MPAGNAMTDPSPDPSSSTQTKALTVGPLQCFTGGLVAGVIAVVLYRMTQSIGVSFAAHPFHGDNFTVQRIASAVRTLVIGMSALGTGIFGFAALGLLLLGVQLLLQQGRGNQP
ncbi:MAG: DUF3082 domain-containing protein [Leptolyngbyaceae cyanobacterium]